MKKTLLLVFALFTVITCLSFTALSAQAATSGYLTYNIENGEAVIKGCDQSATGEIVIPSTLEGYPVTKIAFPGFISCSYITSITLPETITYIEESTFESCDALAKVNISSIKSWCNIQFENTWGNPLYLAKKLYVNGKLLTEIVIPDGITSIGDYAFAGCEMTSITLPKSIQSIGSYAFLECNNLQNLTIPENVTSIGSYALYQCSTLKEINVPSKVKTIGERAFDYCSNLKNINVDKNNVTFCSVDGVLFNKNQTSLIRYPQGKTQTKYIIPSGVSTIEYAAFLECDYLTEISIPDSVTKIASRAFCDCSLLKNIALPSKIKTIASQTFSGCEAIESIVIPHGVKTIEYMAKELSKTMTRQEFKKASLNAEELIKI